MAPRACSKLDQVVGSSDRAREPDKGEYGTFVGLPFLPSARQQTHWRRSFMGAVSLIRVSSRRCAGAPSEEPHALLRRHGRQTSPFCARHPVPVGRGLRSCATEGLRGEVWARACRVLQTREVFRERSLLSPLA